MSLPELGVGIIYSPELEPLLQAEPELVSTVEVEPQTLWEEFPNAEEPYRVSAEALRRLKELPQHKLVHGVGFPVGGSRPPDVRSVPPLRAMIAELQAPFASEHLGFNEALGPDGPFRTGFLLPPRQSRAGAEAAVASIHSLMRGLPVPFAIETGVNYLQPRVGELSDGSFVAAVAEDADCGIVLDLHNVLVNERNGRQPALEFVGELPLERVWEIHVAGGFELDGYWLDAHSGNVPEPLMALAEKVIPVLPNLCALTFELQRDYIPKLGLDGVRSQLEGLQELWQLRRATFQPRTSRRIEAIEPLEAPSPAEWETVLGMLVIGRTPKGSLAQELARDPGIKILQTLVNELRAGMVVGVLRLTVRLLALTLGTDGLRALFEDFWQRESPQLFASGEAEAFASYLEAGSLDIPYLAEVLGFEAGLLRARRHEVATTVTFHHDPTALLDALEQGRLPARSPASS